MFESPESQKIPFPLSQELIEAYRKEDEDRIPCKTKVRNILSEIFNSTKQVAQNLFPIIPTIRNYQIKSFLGNDIIAGLTVSFMQLPQGMAYALVADVPIEVGLFMGFFPVILYFILGSSRHLSFGAIVVVSLMFGSLVEDRFPSNENILELTNHSSALSEQLENKTFVSGESLNKEKIRFVTAISIIAGVTQVLMGILRLGHLVHFLSNTILSAFTVGVALHVGCSQLKNIFGLSIPRYSGFLSLPKTFYGILLKLPNLDYRQLILSLIVILIFYLIKSQINERFKGRLRMPIPIELIIVILILPISYKLELKDKYNFKVIGRIPQGLPEAFVPDISLAQNYISDAISIGIIAFIYSISVALFVARKEGYQIDANQELFAYGISNIVSSFFCCLTASAAVSRTSVAVGAGAKTQVSNLVSALFLLIIIFVGAPFFYHLPICVLSCIILISLRPMFKEVLTLPKVWKICKYDGVIWVVTFLALVLSSVGVGLLIGMIFAIGCVIMRTLRVKATSLGAMQNTNGFLDEKKYKHVSLPEGIAVLSFSSPLYYANTDIFRSEIDSQVEQFKKSVKKSDFNSNTPIPFTIGMKDTSVKKGQEETFQLKIIIECSAISFIDAMGAATLHQLFIDYKNEGIACFFVGLNEDVLSILKASGFFNKVKHVIYVSSSDAILAAAGLEQYEILTEF